MHCIIGVRAVLPQTASELQDISLARSTFTVTVVSGSGSMNCRLSGSRQHGCEKANAWKLHFHLWSYRDAVLNCWSVVCDPYFSLQFPCLRLERLHLAHSRLKDSWSPLFFAHSCLCCLQRPQQPLQLKRPHLIIDVVDLRIQHCGQCSTCCVIPRTKDPSLHNIMPAASKEQNASPLMVSLQWWVMRRVHVIALGFRWTCEDHF